jgi:hypothetical protein
VLFHHPKFISVKVTFLITLISLFVGKKWLPEKIRDWLFGFAKGRLACRAKPNVLPNAFGTGWLKLFLKNAGGKKIKNTGSAMSVGLLFVRLKYGLYVVQLSKWFVLVLMFNF